MSAFAQPLWLLGLIGLAPLILLTLRQLRSDRVRRPRALLATALRCAAIAAALLALAGPIRDRSVKGLEVMFLLDRSDSVGAARVDDALRFVNRGLSQTNPLVQAGLAVVGADASIESPIKARARRLEELQTSIAQDATNLERGIEVALGGFSPGTERRIVLLSDGRETAGDARAAAAVARTLGVRIHAVALSPDAGADTVSATALVGPREVRVHEPFEMVLHIEAKEAMDVSLSVLRNGVRVASEPMRLRAGTNVRRWVDQVSEGGLYEYEAILTSSADALIENNRYQTFVKARGEPRVLYAKGDSAATAPLVAALRAQGFDVHERAGHEVPSTLHELSNFELVVLDNVSGYDLSLSKMELLEEYVRGVGGGLISLGGNRSYSAGGYFDTPIEQLLPVAMDIRTEVKIPSAALVILIDKSGSMQSEHKLTIAKAAAMASVDVLNPLDKVGVIAFDAAFEWVVKPTDAGNRRQVVERLRPLSAGGSTRLYPALEEAQQTMASLQAKIKHLIILSDGLTDSGDDYPELTQRIADDRITVSTVALGRDSDQSLMRALAVRGGGRYYHSEDPEDVPRIFTSETLIATRDLVVEKATAVLPAAPGEVFDGLDVGLLPDLLGFQRTFAKPAATVWLRSPDDEPLLAAWRYGLGKSVAFMSDLSGRWGQSWVTWDQFSRFAAQLSRWTMRKSSDEVLQFRIERTGAKAELVVDATAPDESFMNGLTLSARVVGPDGIAAQTPVPQVAPGEYRAPLAMGSTGRYYITLSGQNGSQALAPQTFGFAVPYSDEYLAQGVDTQLLHDIEVATGGERENLGSAALTRLLAPSQTRTAGIPKFAWPLGVAALCLLLLDLAVRKLQLPAWLSARTRKRPTTLRDESDDYTALVEDIDAMREAHLQGLRDNRDFHPRHGEATLRARLYVTGSGRGDRRTTPR